MSARHARQFQVVAALAVVFLFGCASRPAKPAPTVVAALAAKPNPKPSTSARRQLTADPIYSFTLGEPDSVMLPCALPFRDAEIDWKGNQLAVQLPGREVLTAKQRAVLANGLPMTIAVRVYVFPRPADQPISLGARTCRLAYDLWQQTYSVHYGKTGQTYQTIGVGLHAAMRACFRDIRIADQSTIGSAPAIIATIVDVDPPDALRDEIQKQANAGYGLPPATSALSGTFQSLFCGPINALKFRAQVFQP